VADHPQFKLLETHFPAVLELPHPRPVVAGIGDVHDDANEVVAIGYGALAPMAFDLLRLVTGGAETVDDLKNGVRNPLWRNVAAVIEP
jgi:hypothetical protein